VGRILILEPEAELRDLFARVARRLGHESVTEAGSDSVDAVLVEPENPRTFAAARDVHARFPHVPVICASIASASSDVRRELEPRRYLLKPFPVTELERALSDALSA
jgi:CheY-like chemotaxis protein